MTLSRPQAAALLSDHGLSPRRTLGQNFVVDPKTVRRIARLADTKAGDLAVEIGAGLGSLTAALAETGADVVAVEVDRGIVPVLREQMVAWPNVEVHEADAMELNGHVVTTGGGAVLLAENREALRKGFVIYLDADPEQLWQRLRHDTSRPLLRQSADPRAVLVSLHAGRDPLYRDIADLVVPTTRASVSVVMRAIEQGLERAEVLST